MVIIASMIEREARVPAERAVVAAVIWNRLHEGMLLQIDATIQYALGETQAGAHLRRPQDRLAVQHLQARRAAADADLQPGPGGAAGRRRPGAVDYLYYVARDDGTGRHYFSHDYEQFLVDKAKADGRTAS